MMIRNSVRGDVAIIVADGNLDAIVFFAGLRKAKRGNEQGRDDGMCASVHTY